MRRLAVLICALALATAARAAEPFDPFNQAGIDGRPGAPAPMDLPFTDEAGRTVTLRQLGRGKPIVLAPVQHRCPNICGATLGGLARAANQQAYRPGPDFTVVAFGIDPRERPADAAFSQGRLLRALAGRPRDGVHAVTGTPATVAAVARALGYRYAWDPRLGQYAHIAAVAVLTPDGRLTNWLYGVAPPAELLHTAVAAAGKGALGGLGDRLLLLCYHYDPTAGRYGPLAWTLLRGGGAAAVLALGGFIGLSLLGERRRRREPGP
jgi:protein SCO1/2